MSECIDSFYGPTTKKQEVEVNLSVSGVGITPNGMGKIMRYQTQNRTQAP